MTIKRIMACAIFSILYAFPSLAYLEVGVCPHEYTDAFKTANNDDYEALRQVVYWESGEGACPDETLTAIVETVMNRVMSNKYPNTIYGVIHDRKYGRQFYVANAPHEQDERINKIIENVYRNGRTVLQSTNYMFFATKKQSLGKNHVWIGETRNGKPRKGFGMYFCEGKK